MNVTEDHETSQIQTNINLSANQLRAIELIVSGRSITDTALELGLSRETVSRWKRNPNFIAELHQQQTDLILTARNRLQRMAMKAIDVIETNLNGGSLKAATQVLKMINIYEQQIPETNLEVIVRYQAEEMAIKEMNKIPFMKNPVNSEMTKKLAVDIAGLLMDKYEVEDTGLMELYDKAE